MRDTGTKWVKRATIIAATVVLAITSGPAANDSEESGDSGDPVSNEVPAPTRDLTPLREIVPSEFGLDNPRGAAWSEADKLLVVAGDSGRGTEAIALNPDGSLAGQVDLPRSSDPSTLVADDAGHAVVVDGGDLVEVVIDGAGRFRDVGGAPTGAPRPLEAENPADGLTYVADADRDLLIGRDDTGSPVRSYGMADLGINDLQALAFAPSGDPTDDEGRTSLFLVDAGDPGTNGVVTEVTFAAQASAAPTAPGQLIRTVDTSLFTPTSPDPSGVVWMPDRQRLMISDGEVDEMPLYAGTNLYETTLAPAVSQRGTTVPWSNEPTGVAYNPANGHLFTSDDDKKRIFEVDDGADDVFGTADDAVTSFSTAALGNTDPEDLTMDTATGDLYIVDGLGRGVSRVSPGTNATFDGVPPLGDDTWSAFDLEILGAMDPEGIDYDPVRGTLLVVDDSSAKIYELDRTGSLINAIDISALGTQAAAGVAVAPSSGNPDQRSYYVVDRGLDNNSHPEENDGRMFELSATLPPITNLPPLADAGPDSELELPEQATLSGSFSDDGMPTGSVSARWSVLGGPGPVSFANPDAASTSAGFTTPGVYTLRLTVDDGDRPDIDDAVVTVVATGGVHNSAFPVQVGTDDAEEAASGFVSVTSADLELVDDGVINQTVGMRFGNVFLPAGAVVETAVVQFQTDEALTSADPAALRIQGEASDNAAGYQGLSRNITTRPRTTSSVFWNPDPWNLVFERGPAQQTSNVGPIVQEIVDRPGWVAGNALALTVSGTGRRTAEARDGTQAPVLQVGWRRPVAGANRAPLVSSGAAQQIQLPQTASLSGTVTDDGLPVAPGAVTSTWSMVSGPGVVTFAAPSSPVTTAAFGEPGTYVLRLTGTDGALQAFDEVTVTVLAVDAPRSASIPLATGADDAEQVLTGFMSTTNADLELGLDGTAAQLVGLRYQLPIPAGAIVDSATVRFSVDEVSTAAASLQIQAEAADDAAAFAAVSRNLTNRTRTTASVPWVPAPWPTVNASGPDQTTPNFASVLQEVVDRPGWAAGNHAAALISGTGRRTADALEDGKPAVLDLGWHMPLGGANRVPVAAAGADQAVQLPATAPLTGTVTDDGLPTPPGTVTATWTKAGGPGVVTFTDPASASTSAGFSEPGEYLLRLTADDGALQAFDEAVVTVLAVDAPHSVSIPLPAGADDAEQSLSGFMSTNNADLELGVDGTAAQLVGLRYPLPIPAGAILDTATVRFTVDEVSTAAAELQIQAEAADDAAAFAAVSGNLTNRTRTIASVPWSAAPWPTINVSGADQTTPNLASVLQRVIDRPGWAAGNHAAVLISGTGRRTAEALEGGPAAVLSLTWHMPLGGANRVPVVSAGPDQSVQLPATASLTGSVTDDGLPTPPATVTATWTKVSGPGTVTFTDPAAASTSAAFSQAGTYVLGLTGSDGELQAVDEVTMTVVAADAPQGVTIPLATGADDAEQVITGFMSTNNADLELGVDGTAAQLVGLRYPLPIPAGAIVDSATVRFTVDEVSTAAADLQIQAEAADDAAAFAAVSRNLTDRARTTASAPWAPAPWPTINVSGADQTTPNFASVLQQVIDRPGWAAGNHAAVLISGTGRRTAEALEGGPAAVLSLTWHMPSAGANRVPVVSAGPDQSVQLPATTTLTGTVTDDGLPASVTATWTKVSGPGTVTFTDPAAASTSASFGQAGAYVLRLTGDDSLLQATDDVGVTVLGVDAPQGVTVPLATGADDAEQVLSGFMSTSNADLELGVDGTSSQLVGMRYAVPVPAGAIVDSAVLRFTVDEVGVDPASLQIQAEAADDSVAFAAVSRNLTNRTRTTASVPWVPAPWPTVNAKGPAQTTPSFASVLQQVIDRPGWAAGNHAAVLISGTGRRTAKAFESGPAADLVVSWHMPAPVPNEPPVTNAGSDDVVQLPATAALTGSCTDDGLPGTPGAVTSAWSMVSGAGTVTFADAGAPATSASFSTAGVYVLRLTCDDSVLSSADEVTITVQAPP